jgi:hypothetical protein
MIIWLPTEATLLFVNFLLFDCCVCSCLSCYCHGCCRVLLIWNSMLKTAKDGYRRVIMSHHDFHVRYSTDIWRVLKMWIIGILSFTVSGLLERAAQGERPAWATRSGEQPAQAACSGWAGCLSGLLTTLSLAKKNIVNVNCCVNLPYLFIRS